MGISWHGELLSKNSQTRQWTLLHWGKKMTVTTVDTLCYQYWCMKGFKSYCVLGVAFLAAACEMVLVLQLFLTFFRQ